MAPRESRWVWRAIGGLAKQPRLERRSNAMAKKGLGRVEKQGFVIAGGGAGMVLVALTVVGFPPPPCRNHGLEAPIRSSGPYCPCPCA